MHTRCGLESHGSGQGGLGTRRGAPISIPQQLVNALAEPQVTRSLLPVVAGSASPEGRECHGSHNG